MELIINNVNFYLTCFFINYQKYFILFSISTDDIAEKPTGENKSKEESDVAEEKEQEEKDSEEEAEEEEEENEKEEEEAEEAEEIVK